MTILQFRIRPRKSLADINIPLIEDRMANLEGIDKVDVFDDRATDAMFATVMVHSSDITRSLVSLIRSALLDIPHVIPFIVDDHGNETLLASVSDEFLLSYDTK